MKPVTSLKLLNEGNHARQFGFFYRSIQQRIMADPRWVNLDKPSDLSAVVFDANNRIIMEPGQAYATSVKRASRGKEGFDSPMILLGTPYGVLAIHYVTEVKTGGLDTALAALMNHCTVHATKNLIEATERFIERNQHLLAALPKSVIGTPQAKLNALKREDAILGFLKYWALTSSFFADLDEQADLDFVAKIEVSDGMPKPELKLKRVEKVERRVEKKQTEGKSERRQQERRTKPATPRSGNYTQMTVHGIRNDKKSAGSDAPKRPRGVISTIGDVDVEAMKKERGQFGGKLRIIEEDGRNPVSPANINLNEMKEVMARGETPPKRQGPTIVPDGYKRHHTPSGA